MTYNAAVEYTGKSSESGLTMLVTLSVDKSTPQAAPYRDVGSLVEAPSASYGKVITVPDDFQGYAVFHTGTVGAGSDFSGVTIRGVVPINPWDDTDIDGKTPKKALQYMAAILAGEIRNASTGTETAKGLDGSTDRVQITVDSLGNRTAVSYDP